MVRKYRKVAVGGTFDLLHRGHTDLIKKALEIGDCVAIGLTTDERLKTSPKNHFVAPYDERYKQLCDFLKKNRALKRIEIVPMKDQYGSTVFDGDIEALVVSYETYSKGDEINDIRRRKGFKTMKIITVDAVLADDGLPISTTRIRRGEIDREGHSIPAKEH